jgi:hypothetical protein
MFQQTDYVKCILKKHTAGRCKDTSGFPSNIQKILGNKRNGGSRKMQERMMEKEDTRTGHK